MTSTILKQKFAKPGISIPKVRQSAILFVIVPVSCLSSFSCVQAQDQSQLNFPQQVLQQTESKRLANCSIEKIAKAIAAGISIDTLHCCYGCSSEELKAAGVTAQELKNAGLEEPLLVINKILGLETTRSTKITEIDFENNAGLCNKCRVRDCSFIKG